MHRGCAHFAWNMKVELCDVCARPLWNKLCPYCRGYANGKKETLKNMREVILKIEPSPKNNNEDANSYAKQCRTFQLVIKKLIKVVSPQSKQTPLSSSNE